LPDAPRGQPLCARQLSKPPEHLRAPDVFREGAENCARGGRAPVLISEFRFKKSRQGQTTTAHGDNRRIKIKIPLFFFTGRHNIAPAPQSGNQAMISENQNGKTEPAANETVWAFDLERASNGEGVRRGKII